MNNSGSTIPDRHFKLSLQQIVLTLRGKGPEIDKRVHRVTDHSVSFDLFDESLFELIVNGCSDDEPLSIDTGLARIRHAAGISNVDGLLNVCIFQHEERIVAAQLKHTLLDVSGSEDSNFFTRSRASCKL